MQVEIRRNAKCWLACFYGHALIPNGQWLPLPFTVDAPREIVVADLRRRFPGAAIFVNAYAVTV